MSKEKKENNNTTKRSFWPKFFIDLIITSFAGICVLAAHASENDRIAEQIAAERNQNQIVNNQGGVIGNDVDEGFVTPDKGTPEASVTYIPGPEIENTQAPENTVAPEPTSTSTPVPTATDTPVPTATNTPVPTATDTPVPTATDTPVPTKTQAAVDTPAPTPGQMVTPKPTPTKFATPTPMPTLTATPTFTAVPTNTQKPTNTPRPTSTPRPTYTPTNTPTPTNTAKPSATPTNTPTAAPLPAEAAVAIPVENWYPGLLSMKEESERIYYAYGGLEATDTQPLGIFAQVAKDLWTYENNIEQLLEMFHGYVAEAGMNESDYEVALDYIEKAYMQIELYKELIIYLENNAHENDYDFADADAEKLVSSIDDREGIDILLDKLVSDAYTKYLAIITPTNTPTPTKKAKVTSTPTPTPTYRNTPTPIPTKKVTPTPTPKSGSYYVWTTKSTTLYRATSGSDYYVKIPKDTKISVSDYNSTWYIATYNGYTGYIKKNTNPSTAAPTPTPTPTRVPPVITESDYAQRMVHQARLELEEYMLTYGSVPMAIPDSENKYVHENGRDRASIEWCAVFIMWVADHAGVPDVIVPNISQTDANYRKEGFGTALSWVRGLKTYMTDYWGADYYSLDSYTTSRQNYVPYTPQPGDLIFYKSNTKGEVCHIGIVVDVDTNKKTCTTIEGNTSDTFNLIRTGDCVGQKTRYYERATVVEQSSSSANDGWYIAGFLHPTYQY